jgi:hypothetical protein
MSALVRLYPADWRARYGAEFEALLVERPPSLRDRLDIVIGAVDARISPQVPSAAGMSVPLSSRLSGASAVLGGLLWCVVVLVAGLGRSGGDYTLPILAALSLMLLSLPGRYLHRYARPIALAVAAAALSFVVLLAEILPWGPWLLVPAGSILVAVGPGALALAAARAGFGASARWRLVALVVPSLAAGMFVTGAGLVPEPIGGVILIASLLPLGAAWMFTGARIAAAKASNPMTTTGGLA